MTKHYTGVGSRETPPAMMKVIASFAERLADEGFILRSGAADGADTGFESGHDKWRWSDEWDHHPDALKEIFIAWNGFSGRTDKEDGVYCLKGTIVQEAEEIASTIHKAWDVVRKDGTPVLSRGAKMLHTRNCFQVLGKDLRTPSKFLVCYAPVDEHGVPKGGTRTAWVLAQSKNIPCYNLFLPEHLARITAYLHKGV